MKKQIKDLRLEVEELKKEKMDKRVTRLSEVTVELKVMQEEWIRLRNMLDHKYKSNPSKLSKGDIEILRNLIKEKEDTIKKVRSDNSTIAQICKDKEGQIQESNKVINDLKQKHEKLKKQIVDLPKLRKLLKDKEQETLTLNESITNKNNEINKLKEDTHK